jgi:hypothetical protein
VTLRVRYAREMAQIEIEDTGPGLTAEEIEPDLRALCARLGLGPGARAPGLG